MKLNKLIFALIILLVSCAEDASEEITTESKKEIKTSFTEKQLNITILLDLSDRIQISKHPAQPQHWQRDIEIVKHFVKIFKADMKNKSAHRANGKLKVIVSPTPEDQDINNVLSKLNIDLSKLSNKDKKVVFDNIETDFESGLNKIYSKTLENNKYIGSDIWRFFKNDVVDMCIDKENDVKNILVLVTDGYLYHKQSQKTNKNRTSFLTPAFIRKNAHDLISGVDKASDRIDKYDYGYITEQSDLSNLEILVLEVNSITSRKDNDEDVINKYLSKWFDEMKVKDYKILNSAIPTYTIDKVDDFLNN